jgi:N-formylglutamate deformylase
LPDTDWHLERLYDFVNDLGASVLVATHSRYVVDLNRPPDNTNLYPGQDTTGIVPLDTFHCEPVYLPGFPPSEEEAAKRIETYWRPYHQRLQQALAEIKAHHGYALLWDAHSIFSVLPRFFKGKLPDLNLGTAHGKSCAPGIGEALAKSVEGYRVALNGRFKGGFITRHYGNPANGVHAVQLELSEATYWTSARLMASATSWRATCGRSSGHSSSSSLCSGGIRGQGRNFPLPHLCLLHITQRG